MPSGSDGTGCLRRIGPVGKGGFGLEVALEVAVPAPEPGAATALVEEAHRVRAHSNAARGNIEAALTVARD